MGVENKHMKLCSSPLYVYSDCRLLSAGCKVGRIVKMDGVFNALKSAERTSQIM